MELTYIGGAVHWCPSSIQRSGGTSGGSDAVVARARYPFGLAAMTQLDLASFTTAVVVPLLVFCENISAPSTRQLHALSRVQEQIDVEASYALGRKKWLIGNF